MEQVSQILRQSVLFGFPLTFPFTQIVSRHLSQCTSCLYIDCYHHQGCVEKSDACPVGYYCPEGDNDIAAHKCASGKYCPEGSTTEEDCEEGFFCSTPSSDPEPCPKGSYCPSGSALPIGLTSGYYAVTADGTTATEIQGVNQKVCPVGYFCRNGEKKECHSKTCKPQQRIPSPTLSSRGLKC